MTSYEKGAIPFAGAAEALADPSIAAGVAGLRYLSDEDTPGITRQKRKLGFAYFHAKGSPVTDNATLERIRTLAIPPAWTSVWISPHADSHLAATGRDAKGRKQYRYNPQFVEVRDRAKYEHLLTFAETLPHIRRTVSDHLSLRGIPREKVLATVVRLLEETLIRVGNEDYAKANGSFGLTTLRDRHVQVKGAQLRFMFLGKSGKTWRLSVSDRRVARIVRACQELPGQHLFQYLDDDGSVQKISSSDINAYLRETTGRDITAKDFRTWAGTVTVALALHSLRSDDGKARKSHVKAAIEGAAAKLGNTVTICRKCYVHPAVTSAYEAGEFTLLIRNRASAKHALSAEERAVLAFLKRRIASDAKKQPRKTKKKGAG